MADVTDKMESVETEVLRRYGEGAESVVPELCCPVDYEAEYLKVLPKEILDKDYGCGNPSEFVGEGETALDLGSGAGKICYILSQKVGPKGKVIGVDFNDKMLDLARKYRDEIAEKIGHANVEFRKGMIQDLGLNLDLLAKWLEANPVASVEQALLLEQERDRLRKTEPLVKDEEIDVIVSNCVLNLVRTEQKVPLFKEMFRALKPGGRAVISDIVCDEDPTDKILNDPELWSGCISGAFREDLFLDMFTEAGFTGMEILARQEEPWHTIDGVEFRSMTVRAWKGAEAPRLERNQAVVYKGPFDSVTDEADRVYPRGVRMAVCSRTFSVLTDPSGPYAGQFFGIQPPAPGSDAKSQPFDEEERENTERTPRESKGSSYRITQVIPSGSGCCSPSDSCC